MKPIRATSFSPRDLRGGTLAPLSVRAGQAPWFWYAGFLTLYALCFGLWPVQPLPPALLGANILFVGVCCFPLALWKARRSRNIPMFEIVCLAYAMEFGLAAQLVPNSLVIMSNLVRFDWDSLLRATWLSIVGVSALIAGHEFCARTLARRTVTPLDLPPDPRRINYYLAAAPALSLVALLLRGAASADDGGQWSALIGLLGGQLNIAIVLLSLRFFDEAHKTRLITFLFYCAVFLGVAVGLSSGFLEQAGVPLALVGIVRWHQTRKFPWAGLLVMVVVFGLLNSVKGSYRKAAWFGNQDTSLAGHVTLWGDLATRAGSDIVSGQSQDQSAGDAADTLLSRFDLIHRFEWVLRQTPSRVPYFEGSTYSYLVYGWIPRVIWPDKPSGAGGGIQTDVAYQFVPPENIGKVSIGIGFLAESFANFGVWGVAIVMALQGACFAFLGRLLNGPNSQSGQAIYLAAMVFFLNGIGSSTVTQFGALLQIVLANAVILRCFSTGWRVQTPKTQRVVER